MFDELAALVGGCCANPLAAAAPAPLAAANLRDDLAPPLVPLIAPLQMSIQPHRVPMAKRSQPDHLALARAARRPRITPTVPEPTLIVAVGTYKNSVPANIVAYLQVPVVNRPLVQQHFMEPQPLSPYIGDAMKIYKPPDKYMAHASNRISILSAKKHLALDDLPFAICSKESFRAATGLRNITGSSYLRHKVRLASLCVQKCRTQRWLLEYKIGKSHDTHRFLLALDCDRNDETPLTVRALSAILDQVTNQPVKQQVAADEESMNFDAMLRSICHDLPSLMNDSATKSVCKLLNSELTWAVVTEQLSDLTLQSFRGDTISWSQHLDKNSAAVMVQAERERCASSKWAALAKLYVRVTCHDRYKATYKQERETVTNHRPGNVLTLHTDCQFHMLMGGKKHVATVLMKSTTSGCKNFALSVRGGTGMQQFELAIVAAMMEPGRVRIRLGVPPADRETYKMPIKALVLRRGKRVVERAVTMEVLPNGGWDGDGVVEVWVPIGIIADEITIAKVIGRATAKFVATGHLPVLDEGRWKGAPEALDRILIALGMGNVGTYAFNL